MFLAPGGGVEPTSSESKSDVLPVALSRKKTCFVLCTLVFVFDHQLSDPTWEVGDVKGQSTKLKEHRFFGRGGGS